LHGHYRASIYLIPLRIETERREMAATIRTFDAASPLDAVIDALSADGAVGIPDMVGPDVIAAMDAELAPFVEAERGRQAAGDAPRTIRVGAVLAKSPAVVPVLQSPLIHAVCERILLPHCSCYQLSSVHLIEVPPGSPAGALHRDDVIWPLPGSRPVAVINFLVPLTDFTPRNGGTCVVLGSHRWPRDGSKVGPGRLDLDTKGAVDPASLTPAALPKGSILPVLGGVVHCAGANTTDRPRRALSISVTLGWLRQEENMYLSVPREMLQSLPEDVVKFIGYQIHDPYLGHTGFE
jgi:ectoine hydroxylase-related dioxygenase (phytanoyl-CoA dioxygenase family)